MGILQINTSLFSGDGQSTRLADRFVAALRVVHPGADVVVRDLAREPVPHLTSERFGAFRAKPETRTADEQRIVAESDRLIAELRRADTIVLALPMYNFGVPSTLKAYFDHVARAGVTFRYTANGPVGLLAGKRAIVFATRGGVHAGTPGDVETSYVRMFLAFLGITDVQFVYAEGLAIDEGRKARALEEADGAIRRLIQAERIAA